VRVQGTDFSIDYFASNFGYSFCLSIISFFFSFSICFSPFQFLGLFGCSAFYRIRFCFNFATSFFLVGFVFRFIFLMDHRPDNHHRPGRFVCISIPINGVSNSYVILLFFSIIILFVRSIKDSDLVYNLIDLSFIYLTSINLMFYAQLPANFIIILLFTYFCKSGIDYIQNYKILHHFLNNNIVFMCSKIIPQYSVCACVRACASNI